MKRVGSEGFLPDAYLVYVYRPQTKQLLGYESIPMA
jgi:hypothetical protein